MPWADWLPAPVPVLPFRPAAFVHPPDCINMVNSVSTCRLGRRVDLERLMKVLDFAFAARFRAVILRTSPPETAALVFAEGNVVIIGPSSEPAAVYAAQSYVDIVCAVFGDARLCEFRNRNFTATVRFRRPLDLERFKVGAAHRIVENVSFPGITLKTPGCKTAQIVSRSDALITGARSKRQIVDVYRQTLPLYREFEAREEEGDSAQPAHKRQKRALKKDELRMLQELVA